VSLKINIGRLEHQFIKIF